MVVTSAQPESRNAQHVRSLISANTNTKPELKIWPSPRNAACRHRDCPGVRRIPPILIGNRRQGNGDIHQSVRGGTECLRDSRTRGMVNFPISGAFPLPVALYAAIA